MTTAEICSDLVCAWSMRAALLHACKPYAASEYVYACRDLAQ